MQELAIKIENLKKQYRLGAIGGGTLRGDLQTWWARKTGKVDPNSKIGQEDINIGQTFWALNGIDLEIRKGEALGIIGMNGAGKSTLLKILSRVTAPTEGRVLVNGRIASMLEVGTGFHQELTGRENVYMNGAILGMTKKEVDAKMEDIIEFSECRQFIDTPVKRYSSGMYVKLAFSVAAHLDADIMVMDEVLAVGDMKFQEKCLGKMGDAASNDGKTVLYVSHNMSTIRKLCTRCIVLGHGQVIYDGDVETAIDIYCDNNLVQFKSFYDLTGYKRPNWLSAVKKATIQSIELLNGKEGVFQNEDQIRFRVIWKAEADIDNLRIRFELKSSAKTHVGVAMSGEGFGCKAGEEYDQIFEWNIHNLVVGKYEALVELFEMNQFGTIQNCDVIDPGVNFEVIRDEHDYQWPPTVLGYVKLPPIVNVEKDKNQ